MKETQIYSVLTSCGFKLKLDHKKHHPLTVVVITIFCILNLVKIIKQLLIQVLSPANPAEINNKST